MKFKSSITNNLEKPIIDFGKMPLGNGFLKTKDFSKEFFYRMMVIFDSELGLFQLARYPSPKKMFKISYPFFTSSSKYMISHFNKFSKWIKKKYLKNKTGTILEIGSNDATFLNFFNEKKIKKIGFEPAKNFKKFYSKDINFVNSFFNIYECKKNIPLCKNKVDLVIAANVVCHIPDLISFFKGIDFVLNRKGFFIFEEPYLLDMYKKGSFDQVYDEHIYIFSIFSISKICKIFNLELINCIHQDTHGGSMRYVVARKGEYKISKKLTKLLKEELIKKIHKKSTLYNFKSKIEKKRKIIIKKLKKIKQLGHDVYGYGATSKSTTILNFFNIDRSLIKGIFDTTKNKIGKYSPGKHIPIIDYKNFKKIKPKFIYLFAWNHRKEIINKEKKLLTKKNFFSHVDN